MPARDHQGETPTRQRAPAHRPEDAEQFGTRPQREAGRFTAPGLLALQQTAGNAAVVQRMNTPKTEETDEKHAAVAPEHKDAGEPEAAPVAHVVPPAPAPHDREVLSAAHADQAIQHYLELAPRTAGGVEGVVTLCDENEFTMALFNDMVATSQAAMGTLEPEALEALIGLASKSAGKTHAFNGTSDRRIYLKAGSVDQGVLIHEGVHKYDHPAFVNVLCQGSSDGINEGVTEYFTRRITDALGWRRNAYDSELRTVRTLVAALGENGPELLKAAYFDGALDAFRTAYRNAMGEAWHTDWPYLKVTARGGGTVLSLANRFTDTTQSFGSLFDSADS